MAKQKSDIETFDSDAQDGQQGLRERGSAAIDQFGSQASDKIEAMPLAALAGGLALGAIVASFLPQSRRELQLLKPAGSKIATAGRTSIDKVREAGKTKVDELAGDKLREFFGFGGSSSSTSA